MEEKTTITEPFVALGEVDPAMDPSFLGLVASVEARQFRYLVYSIPNKQVLYSAEYHFPFIKSMEDLLPALRKVLDKDVHLLKPYADFHFLVYPSPTLLPITTPEAQRNAMMQLPYNEELLWDEEHALQIGALYAINRYIRQALSAQHARAIPANAVFRFIQYLNQTADAKGIGILMGNGYFDAAYCSDQSCKSYNRFHFQTAEDFLYYLTLFTASVGVERADAKIYFGGELDINSSIYSICYPYFRELLFMDPPKGVRFSPGLEYLSKSRVLPLLTVIA